MKWLKSGLKWALFNLTLKDDLFILHPKKYGFFTHQTSYLLNKSGLKPPLGEGEFTSFLKAFIRIDRHAFRGGHIFGVWCSNTPGILLSTPAKSRIWIEDAAFGDHIPGGRFTLLYSVELMVD